MPRRHDPVRQKAQCPAGRAFGRVAASKRHQMRLDVASHFRRFARARPFSESRSQPVLPLRVGKCEPAAGLADRWQGNPQGVGNIGIRAFLALTAVSQEQNAGTGLSTDGAATGARQGTQARALVVG